MSAEDSGATAPRLYLLDIEGTVAPLSLTSEILFPYARRHFAEFLAKNSGDAAVRADVDLLAEENRGETDLDYPKILGAPGPDSGTWESKNLGLSAPGLDYGTWESTNLAANRHPERESSAAADDRVEGSAVQSGVLAYIFWLMDRDRKSTALKSLQGKIWKAGFESGELKGMLFADVPPALERWSKRAKAAIYSSGSVEAQKMLFRHTNYGDLTPYLSGYFDTRMGAKTAGASYAAIAAAMSVAPREVLFFSDAVRELDAAREAGCATRLVVREGNAAVEDVSGHVEIVTFGGT
jgi:enolase-phosphatase E1